MQKTLLLLLLRVTVGGFCESILHLSPKELIAPSANSTVQLSWAGGTLGAQGKPEMVAIVTAFFVVFVGLYELVEFTHPFEALRYVSVLVVMNGVSAVANHWNHMVYWAFLDGVTMILAVNLAATFVIETTILLCMRTQNPQTKHIRYTKSLFGKSKCKQRVYGVGAMFLWMLICGVLTFAGMANVDPFTLGQGAGGFIALFNLPILVMVTILLSLTSCCKNKLINQDEQEIKQANKYMIAGFICYLVGFITWNVVEGGCRNMPTFLQAIGHGIWHCTAGWGLHCLLVLCVFLRASTAKLEAKFRTSENKCLKCFYAFMPVVELTECGTGVKGVAPAPDLELANQSTSIGNLNYENPVKVNGDQ